jgi:hypothetical protein
MFPVMRTIEQSINELFVSERILRGDKCSDLLGSRRQACQIEAKAANEGSAISLGRRPQSRTLKPGEDESIDGVSYPGSSRGIMELRDGGPPRPLERPVDLRSLLRLSTKGEIEEQKECRNE